MQPEDYLQAGETFDPSYYAERDHVAYIVWDCTGEWAALNGRYDLYASNTYLKAGAEEIRDNSDPDDVYYSWSDSLKFVTGSCFIQHLHGESFEKNGKTRNAAVGVDAYWNYGSNDLTYFPPYEGRYVSSATYRNSYLGDRGYGTEKLKDASSSGPVRLIKVYRQKE